MTAPMQTEEPPTILVVDDTPANLDLLGQILMDAGYQVRKLPSGQLALMSAQARPPDLILLDIKMPGMDGYEVCKELKENEATREIPVIFISALQDSSDKVEAFAIGAVDYVTKPFHTGEVLARVATHLRLRILQRRLEEQNHELDRLARTDPLTGILNRRSFDAYARDVAATAERYHRPYAVILFDIDHFKTINDFHGHDIGDAVLVVVTQRVQDQLRKVDRFGRWGGEEFIILAPETNDDAALCLARRLCEAVSRTPIAPVGEVTASFGVATNLPREHFSTLIKRADDAMYTAKKAGRNQVCPASIPVSLDPDPLASNLLESKH